MLHRLCAIACFFLAFIARAELRIGAASVRITPDKPTPLAGYYHIRLSTNTHDELHAKAMVLDVDGARAAVVVCDLLTLPRAVVEQAREIVGRTTGVPGANVMISATHTHTGPIVDGNSTRNIADARVAAVVSQYTAGLPAKIAEAVRRAEAALEPARVSAGHAEEHRLAFNRRFFMRDGSVGWNPGKLNTNIVRVAGPIDPDVSVLYCESNQRRPLATYVNFAMHPDTVGGLEFSADYPFTLARLLGEYKGTNMLSLFGNGACGNINHVDVNWSDPQKGHGEAARLGTILAGSVFKAYARLTPAAASHLRVRSEMVSLELPALATGAVKEAGAVVARIGTGTPPTFLEQVNAFKVLDVAAREGRPHQVEVQIIALGPDIAWVSLPGEIFVELGLRIKRASPYRHTFINELANGSIGYVPDDAGFVQGNYEAVSARCAKGSGERLEQSAVKLLRESLQP